MPEPRKILVVGGTGFVGKTLVEDLTAAGRPVLVVSRQPDTGFVARLAPKVTALPLDTVLAAPESLDPVESCVYLASAGRLGDHRDSPWDEAEKMLAPLMRMLHLLRKRAGPVPVVYLSSAAVYGPREADTLHEEMTPKPVTPYGTGKAMAEIAVAAAGRQGGFPTRILRPSTPIGRWQAGPARGAVGALMDAAGGGAPFTLNGDGGAVRDFFDARDLARAIRAALDSDLPGARLWNVGAGRGTALKDLIALVEKVTGRPVPLTRRPMPEGEVARAVLDTTRIRADLGWTPKVPLEAALGDIWSVYKPD